MPRRRRGIGRSAARLRPAGACRTRVATRRSGFSLIEMLVVISVIMALMAIGVGALMGSGRSDRLVATEQLVAGLIRQAKHTARTSGGPVVLRFDPDRAEVTGVTRVPVFSQGFEDGEPKVDPPPPDPAVPAPPPVWRAYGNPAADVRVNGRTGEGARVTDEFIDAEMLDHQLAQHERLRTAAGVTSLRADGFYISCSVRPPRGAAVGSLLPLVVVGEDESLDRSLCGILLQRSSHAFQQRIDSDGKPGAVQAFETWGIVGWINGHPTVAGANTISTLRHDQWPPDQVRVAKQLFTTGNGDQVYDISEPLAGGRWEEIGLMYDGERIVLYRNGRRVAQSAYTGALAYEGRRVLIGWGVHSDGNRRQAADTVIDNVRVARLSTSQPGRMPDGIAAAGAYEVIAHTDGRVDVIGGTVTGTGDQQSASMEFRSKHAGGGQPARVTLAVDVSGRVTSTIVDARR